MLDDLLLRLFFNQWAVVVIISALLLTLTELGFRLGYRLFEKKDEPLKAQIGGVQGAVLGMLGLLLGFTFSMAVTRYETRRGLVLQEANSIGTTYLRASLLEEPHRTAVEDLLRRYVDIRLDFYAAEADAPKIAAVEQKTAQMHRELWSHAVAAGKLAPTPLVATFVNSLNETIDLDASQIEAMRAKVPGIIWLLVLVVAGCGCCASGYVAGASGRRGAFSDLVLPLLIAVVITLISDVARPRQGMISINRQPLLDLKQNLESSRP